jgi:hypothetical protein
MNTENHGLINDFRDKTMRRVLFNKDQKGYFHQWVVTSMNHLPDKRIVVGVIEDMEGNILLKDLSKIKFVV